MQKNTRYPVALNTRTARIGNEDLAHFFIDAGCLMG